MRTNHLGQPIGDALGEWNPPALPARTPMCGRYCRVEPLDPLRHAQDLWHAMAHDTEHRNWTYLMHGPYATLADYGSWIRRAAITEDPLFFAVVDTSSGRAAGPQRGCRVGGPAVGVAAFLRITPDAGSIEVGHINFSPLLQRTQAATEAMYLMMRHAFELGYRRYEWKCDALNDPSRQAAQRLGLSFEGVFRQATVNKGRNRDTAWYATIDKDWPALKAAFETWLAPENFDAAGRQRCRLSELTAPLLVPPPADRK